MTRRIENAEGHPIQVNKKWKELTQYRKDWVLKKARRLFEQKVKTSQQPLTNPERRWLIHSVYGMIKSRGIWIPYEEIYRVLSSKIKKWNDREARRLMMQHPPNEEKQNIPTWTALPVPSGWRSCFRFRSGLPVLPCMRPRALSDP